MPHLVATLIYLSQIYSDYIRGDMSPLKSAGRPEGRVHNTCKSMGRVLCVVRRYVTLVTHFLNMA